MELYNELTFTFNSSADAEKAKPIVADALLSLKYTPYPDQHLIAAADALVIKEGKTLTTDKLAFLSYDLIDAFKQLVKILATAIPTAPFTFSAYSEDTYAESVIDGSYTSGVLEITSTYYSGGDYPYLECPECGEVIVSFDEYDPNRTYTCPECGEEVDLSELYEEFAPLTEKETIAIC